MLEPPFLELAYYVGRREAASALEKLTGGVQPDVLPTRLVVPQIVGLTGNAEEEELEVIGGVIVLRTEGEAFCGTARSDRARLRKLGLRVYERFVHVTDTIAPAYAAILVEYSLEEPGDLLRDSRSLAFQNFFLAVSNVGESNVEAAIHLAGREAYVERRPRGAYISMSKEFNPEGCEVPTVEAQERSVRIASIVARSVRA